MTDGPNGIDIGLATHLPRFDTNHDGHLSTEDGLRQVLADGDHAWFKQDATGAVTGLELDLDNATLWLPGVDQLHARG